MDSVRIGNGCGFWGDNLDAPMSLVRRGRLDYLTLEYLAELTMSILALQKQRNPQAGFATDFVDVLERLVPELRAWPSLKIITNAGGTNPRACARKAVDILKKDGLAERRVAVVAGDDLMPHLDRLAKAGHNLAHLDTGESLETVRSRVVSAHAYLGARPVAEALQLGASIVITGRIADASLAVGPILHEMGWGWEEWDRLASATVAGHLIECGAQATGGLWCRWEQVPDLAGIGYPIVEMNRDGAFVITKPEGTGGAVNRETVAEQLLYEVGDPAAYLTPDVVADFTSVSLHTAGPDQVQVSAARGRPATDTYKVSIAYRDGFMARGTLVVAGPNATAKARLCGNIIFDRLRRANCEPRRINVECLGAGDSLPGVLPAIDPPEVVLSVAVHDPSRDVVERFAKELAPLVTSGPPGVTGYTTGRPPVREVFAYWPALVPKSACRAEVEVIS
jgi:hypothetical protein